ncbi:hypothetical protein DL764_004469 [Monosporascus ibericus]|uniref:PPPDE domain-containing protein n=1 Tax=Monosporascus ibericus TaxID=155417 RepID=A0A4Q4TGJ5_9PEZI|nr:hypothetical protein DL764_004469 [Monosporascus ibericus]
MSYTVFLAIYDVYDERDPNHWAIYIDAGKTGVLLQVGDDKGGVGYYVEKPIYNKEPQRSNRHKESIPVGSISSADFDVAVARILSQPVDNVSTTWNCQAWAVEALDEVERAGIFKWDKKGKENSLKKRQRWQ